MSEIFENVKLTASEITLPTDTMFRFQVTLTLDGRQFTTTYSMGLGHLKTSVHTKEVGQIKRISKTVGTLESLLNRAGVRFTRPKPDLENVVYSLMVDAECYAFTQDVDDFNEQFCSGTKKKISEIQEDYAACQRADKFLRGTRFDVSHPSPEVREWKENF